MVSTQLPFEGLAPKHYNQGLFSDYYLSELIPVKSEWFELENEARQVRNQLRELLGQINPETLDEAQLEELWIQPVLQALGHNYSVQVKIRYREKGYRKPDYILTRSEEDAYKFTSNIYTPAQLKHTLAVCDAKRLGVSFDQAPGRGQRNPSQQIDEYLRYSELPWGILTNGQFWRLYERETSKNNIYYAVDLFDLLKQDAQDFLYFYAFFRIEAFTENWLNQTLEGSIDFAQRIGDQLEAQVYEALELIAQGFLDYRRNNLAPTPEILQTIYEQSLIFLYRLLFVLYAESRQILPLYTDDAYTHNQSLDSIKKVAVRAAVSELDPDHSVYYSQLKDLFFGIDQGNPRFALPAYNGRLFSEKEHPFLTDNAIGDAYLVPAIDKMARVPVADRRNGNRPMLAFIDYRDLDVRHLGAIYEKLLEYDLDIAAEPLAIKQGKYSPAKSDGEVVKQPGQVYLRTGNYERKVTGSYYTPDYIVRFIVEQTLLPLLNEITERNAEADEEGHWVINDPDSLRNEILALNILDPATGSGHFLVEAMNYIAEWLRSLSILEPDDLSNDEDELVYWKRQVVNACIYGVDLNPLAVELAKLSLWLATLSRGRPLSFLDHHVKVGNSLVGAWVQDIGAELVDLNKVKRQKEKRSQADTIGQMVLLDDEAFTPAMGFAVGEMDAIENTYIRTVDNVKQQEQRYSELSSGMVIWKRIADLWLAQYFGLELNQEKWRAARVALLTYDGDSSITTIVAEADQLAREYRFFHWELEFPEVFFNSDGTALKKSGFDAVIGNPPYVRQERIQPYKPYFELNYDIYRGTADLFLYFYEMGLRSLKNNQRLGYITSGTYMNSNSAKKFRKYIHSSAAFEMAVNFGENQPFKGAEMVYPTIAILRKGMPEKTFRSYFMEEAYRYDELERAFGNTLEEKGIDCLSDVIAKKEWRFQSIELTELFKKVTEEFATLGKIVNGEIYYGVKTGLNDAFIIDEDTRTRLIEEHPSSAIVIKPMRRGQDLRPWYQIEGEKYLIFTRQGINIDEYPAIKHYLEQFKERLEPCPDDWDTRSQGQWVGRKSGTYTWYEIQDNVAYYKLFNSTKIIWAEIAKLPRFSVDNSSYFSNNSCYFTLSEAYPIMTLLALMQSRILWFCLSQIAIPLRLRVGLWQYKEFKQFIERLPIPELTTEQESELSDIAQQITDLARNRHQLHEAMRQDIASLGAAKFSRKLREWWELKDSDAFQKEIEKVGLHITIANLSEWRDHFNAQQSKHNDLTEEIVTLETRMNTIVYEAFNLTPREIRLIEKSTKYPYGVV